MATSQGVFRDYAELNTVPAVAGILFAVSSAVQFLGASISIAEPMAYDFTGTHALAVSLLMLVVAFAASDTKSLKFYETWEQLTVALAAVVIVGNEYVTEIADFIAGDPTLYGTGAFVVTMAAWAVLAR